jgi:3-methyladenine DNA glycosylase/8-oxoguanine DNA glycosylase
VTIATGTGQIRNWRPPFLVDVAIVLAPLGRGRGDPAFRHADGTHWLAANTPAGDGTIALRRASDGEVTATAWGAGADWLLDGLPVLLGAADDDTGFVAHHPAVETGRHRLPGHRHGAAGRVWDVLVAAVLEQKVTWIEARRSWRELGYRFGAPAPGPTPGLHLPPTPKRLLGLHDWEWHKAGVDGARRRTLIAAAQVAHALERAIPQRSKELLRVVPGIGVWTAAEVAQRAWGDPDAVSFGDLHIPHLVGTALVGRRLDDAGMAEVLAPYAPQRQRAVRYIEAAGVRVQRFAPRFSPRDYRRL